MILCLVVEAIVILTLVVIIGWNKGVGDWMESLQKPVVRKLEMSGINSPYAVLMQVKGGKIIGNMKGDEKIYPASMTKIMTVIVAIENLDDLDQEITLTQEMFAGLYEQDATQAAFSRGKRCVPLIFSMVPCFHQGRVLYRIGRYSWRFQEWLCGDDEQESAAAWYE